MMDVDPAPLRTSQTGEGSAHRKVSPAFRELWAELSAAEAETVLAGACPEAVVLARVLQAALWVFAARWIGAEWSSVAEARVRTSI